jgi:hypothetical protein
MPAPRRWPIRTRCTWRWRAPTPTPMPARRRWYPGSRCKFAGIQSQDTSLAPSSVVVGLTNFGTEARTAVCPIVNDSGGPMFFMDASIHVFGSVTCTLSIREERGSSSASFSPSQTFNDSSGAKRLSWCGNACGIYASGPNTLNEGVSYAFVCSVPPAATIQGYDFETWVGP